jgi:putative nucleotidyltransferase with HDIG domain
LTSANQSVEQQPQADAHEGLFELVRELGHELSGGKLVLPSFPDVATRVQEALVDPSCCAATLARVAGADPVLAAKLLRMANSALLRRGEVNVTNLQTAVSRLGFDAVRNSAVALAARQIADAKGAKHLRPHLEALWRHSVDVAGLAYVIAKQCAEMNADDAMLAGLLHDIGKFYILRKADAYSECFAEEGALQEIMHSWHGGVGRAILEAWDFHATIVEVADEHDNMSRQHLGRADLCDVVMAANVLVHRSPGGRYAEIDLATIPAFSKLKLGARAADALLECSSEQREELFSIFTH